MPRARDHAYSSFTEKLLAQDIAPGQIVSQRELVELTGMPLGAIREMIPRLEADGLIQTVPQRGLKVLSIDLELVRNAFQLRHIVEGEAVAVFCATAPDGPCASPTLQPRGGPRRPCSTTAAAAPPSTPRP